MTRSALHLHHHGPRIVSPAIVWNTVMPALGVALVLGASIVPALAVAAGAALAMHAVSARRTRGTPKRQGGVRHVDRVT